MKKLFVIGLATVAFGAFATPAMATDLNINLQGTNVSQQIGPVGQQAASVAAAVGTAGNDVDITSAAVNAGNIASIDQAVDQLNSSLVNGNGLATSLSQSTATATQAALSIAGSGNLGAGGAINSTAANLGNSATVTVRVSQH